MSIERPSLSSRLSGFGNTIFAEMSALATATGSVNLGQGFPDVDGPDEIKQSAIDAILAGYNQYPPGTGIGRLRDAICEHQSLFYGLTYDRDDEVLVTAGATEAIAAALLGLCDDRDEVVMFEPYYDSYAACTAMAGATRKVVTLDAPEWNFDRDAFDSAITDKTRLVLLNSPHNPTGKVFSDEELSFIARRCVEHDLLALTDEVYEHLVFSGTHRPLASFPGMAERTLAVSSAGKTFSFTGWKVGWVCGPSELVAAVRTAKQFLTYVNAPAFQVAIADALEQGDRFITGVADALAKKRDILATGLSALGFSVIVPDATYFVTTDISEFEDGDATRFCLALPKRCGVVAIPSTVFYDDKEKGRSLVRWAFCKRDEVLRDALTRLRPLGR